MQYVKFPMSVLRITQGYGLEVDGVNTITSGGTYSHTGAYALDLGGADTGADYLYAPCDVTVVRHYVGSGYNAVWYQTVEPVMCADGQERELVFMLLHANDSAITELGIAVGKKFLQGEAFYKEGTGGGVGTHCHIEVGLAPFTGTGWAKSSYVDDRGANVWIINNKLIPSEIFYLTPDTVVMEDMGYNWKYLPESSDNPDSYADYTTRTRMRIITSDPASIEYFNSADVNDVAGKGLSETEYVALGQTNEVDSSGWKYVKFMNSDGNIYWVVKNKNNIELYEVTDSTSNIIDKTFFIKAEGTDYYLNVHGVDTVADGRNVNVYSLEDCQAQRWVLKESPIGLKLYTKINETFALNIYTDDNYNCTMYTAEGNDADSLLEFELVEEKVYKIKMLNHSRYLTLEDTAADGTNVRWTSSSSKAISWRFLTEEEAFPTTGEDPVAPEFYEDGIDVSDYQGVIDWAKVAQSGQKFAIIKAVGSNDNGIYISDYWESNYLGCKENNIKVGAYLYTYAFNEAEADEELVYLFKALKGKSFEYPIFVDVEDSLLYQNCTKEQITRTTKYLCQKITDNGYYPAVYTYSNFAKNYLDMSELSEYDLWIADYTGSVTYSGTYTMWQYSSSGSVDGIDGRVDMNISYKDYASLLIGQNDGLEELPGTEEDTDNNEGGNTKMSTLNTRIVLRNDSTINWNANPTVVLLKGEIGIEFLTDGKAKVKIGDGVTPWSSLTYFSDDYTKSEVDSLIATAKAAAISESVATVLGEGVDAKYDTLVEVANWILSDTTSSAELVAKVNAIEEDYLKGSDKEELQGNIDSLAAFVGSLPEDSTSSTVVAYITEVVDGLKIGDYAKADDLTAVADRVTALEGRASTIENNITNIISSVASVETELAKKVDAVEGYRMVSDDEAEKLEKLVLNEDGSVEVSGTIAAGNVDGLADWITARAATLKGLSENNLTDVLLGKLNSIEDGAQVNIIEEISVNDITLGIVDKVVNIKTTDIVKASDEITVGEDGTLGVGEINVSKLVQGENEVLILNGGSATI